MVHCGYRAFPLRTTLLLPISPTQLEHLLTANILYETASNPQTGLKGAHEEGAELSE